MKYQISCIGKSSNSYEQKLIENYLNRLDGKIKIKEINLKNPNPIVEIEEQGNKVIK